MMYELYDDRERSQFLVATVDVFDGVGAGKRIGNTDVQVVVVVFHFGPDIRHEMKGVNGVVRARYSGRCYDACHPPFVWFRGFGCAFAFLLVVALTHTRLHASLRAFLGNKVIWDKW